MKHIHLDIFPSLIFILEGRKKMFYLITHLTHFMQERKPAATTTWTFTRDLLYASSHRQDSTYHDIYDTSLGTLAGKRVLFNKHIYIYGYMASNKK